MVPLDIGIQAIEKVQRELPRGLRLTVNDCTVLLFVERNRTLPFKRWPKEYRHYRALAKLCRNGYLGRVNSPKRFLLADTGCSMVRWLLASLAHSGTKPGPSKTLANVPGGKSADC